MTKSALVPLAAVVPLALLALSLAAPPSADAAAVADPGEIAACRAIADPVERAGCYDQLFGGPGAADASLPAAPPTDATGSRTGPERGATALARDAGGVAPAAASLRTRATPLAVRWELDPGTNRGLWLPRGHRRTYILPAHWSDHRNDLPSSPTQESTAYDAPLEAVETRFQLSLKLKAFDDLLGSKADLWLGYTQQSFWQVYNAAISRPFRETNYEPEVFATIPARFEFLGLTGRMVNVGFVHQSNGQSDPRSRSWNRVYAQVGFERGPFTLLVRPWLRLNEKTDDDNPDIMDYVGRADALAAWSWGERTVSLLLRNSLRDDWRGYAQLDYSFPVIGNLKGYVQVSTGYGESLIDYDLRSETVRFGFSLWR